ncbi:hypothetical protein HMPREF0497_0750 [Lentilactobacillus buchneri ATCC 11577]|uniref:Uncharacterized protein n=1 Tax=Lentilactobacillus hilgardii (strain ATCC 8290 / DSM 20176 / CCUG 30140 / JCM 1155 / KCTC 3500 / NBRC 15886 / NCIMB 8040 / NRRL B-1843 / 9) TaxID=1423757 RepID=C0XJY4_LENH9|nr:hypothetical protein HMPREF0497_0750 [Lentilactobacillus buchneri ATCC 11577]EEI24315.1 hypothetical protein HMPREF0519_1545 [Lentilactobacillus hilgardii DSM 20176 = ATCC 8290]KRK58900.1 hypothetical protein FD42_GL001308 [Lentilactobacillus hilgardii DSM 20176 = ATCC 8290]
MTFAQKIFTIWVILLIGLIFAIIQKNKAQIAFCAFAWAGFTISTFVGVFLMIGK